MVKHLMASTAGLSSLARPQPKKKVEEEKLKTSAQPMAADDDKDDDDDKDKEDKGKAKKAKKAEGDDEDDDEDDDDKSKAYPFTVERTASATQQYLNGAADERKKMKAILASEAGAAAFKANPDKVMRFLTSYSGTTEDAIATLELLGPTEAAPAARTESPLRERMAESKVPVAGPDATGEVTGQDSVVNLILAADKMRRGEK